jgi:chorismate mutase
MLPANGDTLPFDVAQCAAIIDEIDREFVSLLLARFRYSRRIGELKAQAKAPAFDPSRVASQKAAFVKACEDGGLDEPMARGIIDAIVDRVVAERLAAAAAEP